MKLNPPSPRIRTNIDQEKFLKRKLRIVLPDVRTNPPPLISSQINLPSTDIERPKNAACSIQNTHLYHFLDSKIKTPRASDPEVFRTLESNRPIIRMPAITPSQTPHSLQTKRTETPDCLSPRSPAYRGLISENSRKYEVSSPRKRIPLRSPRQLDPKSEPKLIMIKAVANFRLLKKIAKRDPIPDGLLPIPEVSAKSNLNSDQALNLSIWKIKSKIWNTFKSTSSHEAKKQLYKNYLLEYHPDKSKLDPKVATEIFTYLNNSKEIFLPEMALTGLLKKTILELSPSPKKSD